MVQRKKAEVRSQRSEVNDITLKARRNNLVPVKFSWRGETTQFCPKGHTNELVISILLLF
jgi:hypothetical protein